ncbi:DUF4255 domain-containing protein [Nakamurella sp.]|uniref:DUF4255 domain-containing protein n=1 Tax=Nakamurella sp. TaxID=1869182 RepID=UPI003B3AF99B
MTTSLGIAATTAVLRQLLQNEVTAANVAGSIGGSVTVSALPPDRIDVANEKAQLNLFMYQVRPNAGWSTTAFPSHDGSGRRLTNPPLALDLSYMLSAYGAKDFDSEILLGLGALVLHQTRVLSRDLVAGTFSGGALPPDLTLLATAGLDSQEELVSLSMEPMTVDDLSRLWQVFGEKYRPSIAFQAHVLLLRGADAASAPGPPVSRARLATSTSINPTISAVQPVIVTAGPTATITLVGTGLLAPGAVARFGTGASVPATPPSSTPSRVVAPLPSALLAGLNTVRMVLPSLFESDERGGPESNTVPFSLRPAFAVDGGGARVITFTPPGPGSSASTTLTVQLVPPVARRQEVTLLLNEVGAPAGTVAHSYTFSAPSRQDDPADTTDTIAFAVTGVNRARYLVRVRVDGAETELTTTGGVYDQPSVDLS